MSQQHQHNVTVSIDGLGPLGTFDKKTGGKTTGEGRQYRPGGMASAEALGGVKANEPIAVERRYKFDRDHPLMAQLRAAVNKKRATITDQPLDEDGNVFLTDPEVFTGVLTGVKGPDHDSESTDVGMLELEFELDEPVS